MPVRCIPNKEDRACRPISSPVFMSRIRKNTGATWLARGGEIATLEGEPEERRVVIVEFPSLEAARTFYDSPEYREARAAREGAAEAQFFVVEGLEAAAG